MAEQLSALYTAELARVLRENPGILTGARNDSSFATSGNKTIYWHEIGTNPTVTKNPTSDAASSAYSDDSRSYALDEFATNAAVIKRKTDYFLRYDQVQGAVSNFSAALREATADALLKYVTAAKASYVKTTGEARSSTANTGNLKAVQYEDVLAAISKIKPHRFSMGRKVLFINQEMLNDLKNTTDFKSRDYMMRPSTETGMVLYVHGFEVRVFDHMPVGTINNSGALSPAKHSTTATANTRRIALFVVLPELRYAIVNPHVFVDADNPLKRGTVFSAHMFGGAAVTRSDAAGLSLLVEG